MPRPRKNADEKRSETARFRVTPAERETIRTHAARHGLDETEFMRRRVFSAALPSSSQSSSDPAKIAALNAYAVALGKIGNNVNQLAAATHQGRDFVRFWRELGAELQDDLRAARKGLDEALKDQPAEVDG